MGKKTHPLEAAFVDGRRIALPEGEVAKDVEVHAIPIPWSASDGLCVFDLFAGAEPVELPVPPTLERMPPLRFTTSKHGALFLGQRWSDAEIVAWRELGFIGIDRAALCVTPRSLASESLETDTMENELASADRGWCRLKTGDGTDFIAINVHDDGAPELYGAHSKKGELIGWVLNLAYVELPWSLPEGTVPPELVGFIKPQIRYAVAGRRAPTVTFNELVQAMKLPERLLAGRRGWDGSGIGELQIKDISAADYHFYEKELRRIGIPQPASLFRVVFAYHYLQSVRDTEWRAMLGVMAHLARDTRGILYRLDGDDLLMHDFGSP